MIPKGLCYFHGVLMYFAQGLTVSKSKVKVSGRRPLILHIADRRNQRKNQREISAVVGERPGYTMRDSPGNSVRFLRVVGFSLISVRGIARKCSKL